MAVDAAVGRVSAEAIAGYPPGIPALLPGRAHHRRGRRRTCASWRGRARACTARATRSSARSRAALRWRSQMARGRYGPRRRARSRRTSARRRRPRAATVPDGRARGATITRRSRASSPASTSPRRFPPARSGRASIERLGAGGRVARGAAPVLRVEGARARAAHRRAHGAELPRRLSGVATLTARVRAARCEGTGARDPRHPQDHAGPARAREGGRGAPAAAPTTAPGSSTRS